MNQYYCVLLRTFLLGMHHGYSFDTVAPWWLIGRLLYLNTENERDSALSQVFIIICFQCHSQHATFFSSQDIWLSYRGLESKTPMNRKKYLTLAFAAADVEQNSWTRHLLHFPYHCHRSGAPALSAEPLGVPHSLWWAGPPRSWHFEVEVGVAVLSGLPRGRRRVLGLPWDRVLWYFRSRGRSPFWMYLPLPYLRYCHSSVHRYRNIDLQSVIDWAPSSLLYHCSPRSGPCFDCAWRDEGLGHAHWGQLRKKWRGRAWTRPYFVAYPHLDCC